MAADLSPENASPGRWLSIVGIGEDGAAGLGEAAQEALRAAALVFGGSRHLALAAPLIRGEARAWPSPFADGMDAVLAARGTKVCVLASGDPFLHGVGATLAPRIEAAEMAVYPAPSAFSLAAARLGWPLHGVTAVSLHGRSLDLVRPHLSPGARLLALTSDGRGPAAVARLLSEAGFGSSRLTVLEALGGPRERIRQAPADDFALTEVDPLNVLAVEVAAQPGARIVPLAAGRPDTLFEHDGQLTRREIRAVVLSSLAPRQSELLWDVGSGSGSVAIEWMLAHPSLRAVAVERVAERAQRILRNAAACGVPALGLVEGEAPAALAGLEAPDAVFVGGGGSDDGVMAAVVDALKPGGRLVANAVTLEMEAVLLAHRERLGGELLRLSVARAAPVGAHASLAPGDARHPMDLGKAMLTAGIGCRRGVGEAAVVAAIRAALAHFDADESRLLRLATGASKRDEPAIREAGRRLGVPLTLVEAPALRAAEARILTRSARSRAAAGVGSLSEAAALAAAGPDAMLLGPRLALGGVTCALAIAGGAP